MDRKKAGVPLVCHGHSRPVVDLFYSPVTPDGCFLISASKDSNPMIRNGDTGDWIGTFEGHKGAVWSCCLDTNALRAASGSADFSAKVWDALTGEELHSFEHKHIVRACLEKILRIYDMNRPDAAPREIDKSPGSVRTVAWLHSDQSILSCCTDMGGVRLWDVRSGKIAQTLETKATVTSAEVSQDGRFGLVKSYNMPCNVESASLEPKYGNKFIAGGEDMWVHVFDFFTGEEITCKPRSSPLRPVCSWRRVVCIRIRGWKESPPNANGKLKVNTVSDAARKIEGFHLPKDGQPEG
uniref:Serine-threonine kinase receptor-associated protein n=1 Tax=Oryza glumipatula TaxID=40148 RepID=A0A0D9YP13_9ORYZ